MRFPSVDSSGCHASHRVLPMSDQCKMARIAASSIAAQVVTLKAVRDGTVSYFPNDTVGTQHPPSPEACTDDTVARCLGTLPYPTSVGAALGDMAPDSNFKGDRFQWH